MGGSEESFLDEGELDFFPDDYFEEPTPALKGYPDYKHSKCPAFKEYYKNTWVMKQCFPLGILYKSPEQYLETNLAQDVFDEYFMLGDGWTDGINPEVQFKQDEQAGEIVTVGDAITIIKENKAGKPRKVNKRKVSKSFAEQTTARAEKQAALDADIDKALDED